MIHINTKRQYGFFTSSLTTTMIGALLLIISLAFTLLFAMTLIDITKESKTKSALIDQEKILAVQVAKNFKQINSNVNEAVTFAMQDYDSENFDGLINKIKQKLPQSLRVTVSNKELTEIIPEYFPGINYATLDMLKQTQLSNKNPIAEIHLFGQQDQYLNYVYIIDNTQNTYLIISLPVNEILENLANPQFNNGTIDLVQRAGNFSKVILKSWGVLPDSKGDIINNSKNIPQSYFNLNYSYRSPNYFLKGMTKLSTLIGMASSALLLATVILSIFKSLKTIKQKKREELSYVHVEGKKDKPKTIQETIDQQETKQIENKPEKNNQIDETIFRAYDIRGVVDETLTVDAVKLIGQSIGTENIKRGKNDIVVARDGRLSGPKLLNALIEGLNKSGCNVINIGAVPTGVLYFATHHLGTGSGVMLTGSHNPPNYNGLKIMLDGETLAGDLIKNLYKSIIFDELDEGEGNVQEMDIVDDYVDYISSDIQLENELKVVVDCGNGIGGDVGPQVLEEIGCEVIRLHCEIDGSFPNHHPDPSVPENLTDLITAVKASDADIGIAFDGDADRLGVVTKNGEMIYSDRLLMLFAKDVLIRQPGSSIIFDVKCTGHLPKEIVKSGGLPIMWKTGHSFMKAKLKETKAALAGEMSGHFFFNERWFGFDDGIYAAARLFEILDQEDRSAQEVFDDLPNSVSTPELKCDTEEGENYAFMDKFTESASFPDANITTIDGIRADFADGWGLIRCSNTTPCLVMRFDADSEEALEKIKEEFRVQIQQVDDKLNLPF